MRLALELKTEGSEQMIKPFRRRFGRSLPNFLRVYKPLVDSWTIFYNLGHVPILIAFEESRKIEILDPVLFNNLLKYKEKQ